MKNAFRGNYWHSNNSPQNMLIMSHDPMHSWDLANISRNPLRKHPNCIYLFIPRFACEKIRLLFKLRPIGWGQAYCTQGKPDLMPLVLSDSLCPPTCTGDIVLLQNLVVSAGTHSASWDGKAEGTTASIIHATCVVTCKKKHATCNKVTCSIKAAFPKPGLSAT